MDQINSKIKHRYQYREIRKKAVTLVEKKIYQVLEEELNILFLKNQLKGYIGIYWPLPGEVNILSLKKNLKLKLALPATSKGGKTSYHKWGEKPLTKDFCGIPSPADEPILRADALSLLIVPALAIDYTGQRLGYGGGYFDRLRSEKSWFAIRSLVVLPKACVSKKPLPKDSWDIPFSEWLTEEGCFKRV